MAVLFTVKGNNYTSHSLSIPLSLFVGGFTLHFLSLTLCDGVACNVRKCEYANVQICGHVMVVGNRMQTNERTPLNIEWSGVSTIVLAPPLCECVTGNLCGATTKKLNNFKLFWLDGRTNWLTDWLTDSITCYGVKWTFVQPLLLPSYLSLAIWAFRGVMGYLLYTSLKDEG